MRSTPPLEGVVVIVQDEADTARKLELALSQKGATVFTTSTIRETVDLMWSLKPSAVVLDPTPDMVGALFLAAQAKEQGITVVHYADGDQGACDIRVARTKNASAVVDGLVARFPADT
ncbi:MULTISPECIES: hypothetical protein [Rhizobium]|uniref:hypothetical protein n=1 Tax=Rhizobium TaxID=379 RepID=UPI002412D301|nr:MULTISPECIES: hypothetical protein [Rhizobium]MDG3576957.1 hypothetical protein [Rhizobium sp. YJ-22]